MDSQSQLEKNLTLYYVNMMKQITGNPISGSYVSIGTWVPVVTTETPLSLSTGVPALPSFNEHPILKKLVSAYGLTEVELNLLINMNDILHLNFKQLAQIFKTLPKTHGNPYTMVRLDDSLAWLCEQKKLLSGNFGWQNMFENAINHTERLKGSAGDYLRQS